MVEATLFVHDVSFFRGLKKNIGILEIKFWSCTEFWILSTWSPFLADSVIHFSVVLISSIASDGD